MNLNDVVDFFCKFTNKNSFETKKYAIVDFVKSEESARIKSYLKMHLKDSANTNFYNEIICEIRSTEQKDKFNSDCENCVKLDAGLFLTYRMKNSDIYIYGTYEKMSRNMSQTPMKIKGKLKYEKSVSDFAVQFKAHFSASEVTFIPAGREDCDVRCFGRAFILKVINPTTNIDNFYIKLALYEEIKLRNLCVVDKAVKDIIFNGETKAKKTYLAFVHSCVGLNQDLVKSYEIKQKTPLRVLHRRPNLERTRNIEITDIFMKNDLYEITMFADAGAYIKEFVNGDFGRTTPSLSSLTGKYADCVCLDVFSVLTNEIPAHHVLHKFTIY